MRWLRSHSCLRRVSLICTMNAPIAHDVCQGPPVVNPTHGGVTLPLPLSPYLGALSAPAGSTIIPMWVETFGGDDFSLCGTGGLPTVSLTKDASLRL